MDLRNGHMLPEYCDRDKYVNLAVAIQTIKVPCSLFEDGQNTKDQFWKAAQCISHQWEVIKAKKGLARTAQSDAKRLIERLKGTMYVAIYIVASIISLSQGRSKTWPK